MAEDPAAFDAMRVHAAATVVAGGARGDAAYEDFVTLFEAGDAGARFVDAARWLDDDGMGGVDGCGCVSIRAELV